VNMRSQAITRGRSRHDSRDGRGPIGDGALPLTPRAFFAWHRPARARIPTRLAAPPRVGAGSPKP
jgi:hypothetical protein